LLPPEEDDVDDEAELDEDEPEDSFFVADDEPDEELEEPSLLLLDPLAPARLSVR
jgi:hypothetical protein